MSIAAIAHKAPAPSVPSLYWSAVDGMLEQRRHEARHWLGQWWTDIEAAPIGNAMVAWLEANPEADDNMKRRAYARIAWRLS